MDFGKSSQVPVSYNLRDNRPVHGNNGKQNPNFEKSSLYQYLNGKTLKDLEAEEKDKTPPNILFFPPLGKDSDTDLDTYSQVLHHFNGRLYTHNVMGFLSKGQERMTISSRFSDSNGHHDYFLHYMLQKVACGAVINMDVPADTSSSLRNLLIYTFPSYLKRAIVKGIYRRYVRREYNDAHVRGTIAVARYIRLDVPFNGKVAYSTREFTDDNPVTELVRHAVEYIRSLPYGRQILNMDHETRTAVGMVEQITLRYRRSERNKILMWNKAHPVVHPYYSEYKDLQRLCIWILERKSISLDGKDSQIHGVLFDGAALWEEYVAGLVSKDFCHPNNRTHYLKHQLFRAASDLEFRHANQDLKQGIYPDFLSRWSGQAENDKTSKQPAIMDAKYKPSGNIGRDDYFQVLSYMLRFDSRRGIYIYPGEIKKDRVNDKNGNGNGNLQPKVDDIASTQYLSLLEGHLPAAGENATSGQKDRTKNRYLMMKLGFQIPQSSSFEEFIIMMQRKESVIKEEIEKFIAYVD
jgi:5-methylcytosine-specific restriction endonuclease McrBC regulatory subunit McrC